MTRIVSITNQKGGVGKTTTAVNLASGLSHLKKKVLVIDLDPQSSLTFHFAVKNRSSVPSAFEFIQQHVDARINIKENIDLIPSNKKLEQFKNLLGDEVGKEILLAEALEAIKDEYDYIVIDCPPQLSVLTDMAYTASNGLIITMSTDMYSVDGIAALKQRVNVIKKIYNTQLVIDGILITNAKLNTNSLKTSSLIAEQCCERIGTTMFKVPIRNSTVVQEAQMAHQSLIEFAPKKLVTLDYQRFIEEWI